MKPVIKTFMTKGFRFSVKITEPDGLKYEVIIGGRDWLNGRGNSYSDVIMHQISTIKDNAQKAMDCLVKRKVEPNDK